MANPPDWKRFWQRFRSHDSKIAQLNVQLLSLLAESEEALDPEVVEVAEALFDYGLMIRNSALYADTGPEENFRKPSDIDFSVPLPVLRNVAKIALAAADRRGGSIDDIELSLREVPSILAKQKNLKVLFKAFQRARDAGVSKDQLEEIITKSYGSS